MPLPDLVVRLWREMDSGLDRVQPTPWGAVVTDRRFPAVHDVNYARIEPGQTRPTREEVEQALLAALDAVGAGVMHVVSFDPGADRDLLAALSSDGHRLSFDAVMVSEEPPAPPSIAIEELTSNERLWGWVADSLALFGVSDPTQVRQMVAIERDVLAPAGKRWFGVTEGDEPIALAAGLVLDGVGYLDNVATVPRARGRGLASALASRAALEALDAGADEVFLVADPQAPRIMRMYERLGFREAGRLGATRGPRPDRPQPGGGS